jgi:hypothetical protein
VNWNPYRPLPIGALRDLFGVTRPLYRACRAENPPEPTRLQALELIGRDLKATLRAAGEHPGTIAHLEAWEAAERATRALQQLVGESTPLAPVIAVTAACISRGRQTLG